MIYHLSTEGLPTREQPFVAVFKVHHEAEYEKQESENIRFSTLVVDEKLVREKLKADGMRLKRVHMSNKDFDVAFKVCHFVWNGCKNQMYIAYSVMGCYSLYLALTDVQDVHGIKGLRSGFCNKED